MTYRTLIQITETPAQERHQCVDGIWHQKTPRRSLLRRGQYGASGFDTQPTMQLRRSAFQRIRLNQCQRVWPKPVPQQARSPGPGLEEAFEAMSRTHRASECFRRHLATPLSILPRSFLGKASKKTTSEVCTGGFLYERLRLKAQGL